MSPEHLERWHERINEINDICNTTIVTDQMTTDEVIEVFQKALNRIQELATYPDEPLSD